MMTYPNIPSRTVIILCLLLISAVANSQSPVIKYRIRVEHLIEIEQYSTALKWLDTLIRIDPAEKENYFRKGYIYAKLKQYAESNENYTAVLKLDPNSKEARFSRASTWLELSHPDSAILDLNAVIGQNRSFDSSSYRLRSLAYYKRGNFLMAKRDFDSLSRFNPNDEAFYKQRANIRNNLNDINGAIDDITILIGMKISDPYNFQKRAFLYARIYEWNKCIEDCNTFLSKTGPDVQVLFIRGCAFLQIKSYYKASDDFETCGKMKLESNDLFKYRGTANFFLANDAKAIHDLTKVWERDQSDVNVLYMIGVCKNNQRSGSGCPDLKKAMTLGSADAKRIIHEFCPP